MLEIDLEIIAAQAVTFAIAIGLLWWIVFRPATAFLRQRADRIAEDQRRAADERHAGERLRAEYERQLADIAAQAQAALRAAMTEARQARDAIMDEARRQSDAVIQRGQEQLAVERTRVIREMRQQVLDLSMQITGKVLSDALTPDLRRQLLDKAILELEAMPK